MSVVARKICTLLIAAAIFGLVGIGIGIHTLASSDVECNGVIMNASSHCGLAELDRAAKRSHDVSKAWQAVAAGFAATVIFGGSATALAIYSIRRQRSAALGRVSPASPAT